jgi:hypothetical protein
MRAWGVDVLLLHQPFTVSRILFFPIACLIAYNLYGNYYYVVTVDPGNPISVLTDVRENEPWMLRGGQEVGRGLGRKGMKACGKCGGPKPVVSTPFDSSGLFSFPATADTSLLCLQTLRHADGSPLSL